MKKYIFLSVFVSIFLGYIPFSHSMDQEERRPPNIKLQYRKALKERTSEKKRELEEERTQNPNKVQIIQARHARFQRALQDAMVQKFANR